MMNGLDKRLFNNFLALSIIQGTNFLLPIIVMPYVIGKIGTAGFGIVSVAQVVLIYFSTISDYGFNLTATRDIARYKNDEVKISRIFFLVLSAKIIITLALFFILLILISTINFFGDYSILYLLGFTYVIGQTLMVSWFFQGVEKMGFITLATLASRSLFVLLTFLFIKSKVDFIYFLFFLGIGNIVAGLISITLAVRIYKLKLVYPSFNEIVFEIREGWQITISNLSINTFLYINIFVLRLFTNNIIVGYYSIAEKIFFAIRQILGVFSQVIYPRVCHFAFNARQKIKPFFRNIYLPFLFLVVFVCLGIFIFSGFIINIFISTGKDLPILLLKIFSIVPIIVCLNIPAYQLLIVFNFKKSYTITFTIATIINLLSNIILCSKFGAVGTVISIILTELFITIGLNQQMYKNKLAGLIK